MRKAKPKKIDRRFGRHVEKHDLSPTENLFNILRANSPRTAKEARRVQLPIGSLIGKGAYRQTYSIDGHPDIVIKFPRVGGDWEESASQLYGDNFANPHLHVDAEMANIEIINSNSRYALLRPHVVTIYYFDPVTRVQIEKRYVKTRLHQKAFDAFSDWANKILGVDMTDFDNTQDVNTMKDENGRFVIVDLGFLMLKDK